MVEMAGIEPASEKIGTNESTARSVLFDLNAVPKKYTKK